MSNNDTDISKSTTSNIDRLKVPRLISDGMVLQKGKEIKIWGWAPVDKEVTVDFMNKEYSTRTGYDGKWSIMLPAFKAGGPYKMVIKESTSVITINDILIGDVWICSGQSNMEIPMSRVRELYENEITKCQNYKIRQFNVLMEYNFNGPQEDLNTGNWVSANSNSILNFSAVAYFFAKKLYKEYQVPIGLIKTSIGGSPVEAWLSEEALKAFPSHLETALKYKDNDFVKRVEQRNEEGNLKWYKKLYHLDNGQSEGKLPWYDSNCDISDWSVMELPTLFVEEGLENLNGVIWFRKEIEVPASMIGKAGKLYMGRIIDGDTTYINGIRVGATTYQYPPRKYDFPDNLLKKGKNTITLRVVIKNGQGGFIEDKPYKLSVGEESIDLKGDWKYKVGAVTDPLPEWNFVQWKPLGLYNGMIAPLLDYKVKGVIWYQGESNTEEPHKYNELFPALIWDWREQWNQKDLPFLYVQLPNYGEVRKQPSESNWAELREAQLKTLAVTNNTAMAVAIDVGEWNDLHPFNKKDVGNRLALAAQHLVYGNESIVYSGPIYQSKKIEDSGIIISFNNIGSGLMIKGSGKLNCFEIAGPDKKFVWAEAEIEGNQVVVKSEEIDNPVEVRYAWADNPEGANLYNKEGLPASPFRTDK